MSVLNEYFTRGRSIIEIAARVGEPPASVRDTLRCAGVVLPDDAERDMASEAARGMGYLSFAAWVKDHGPEPILDQARQLGVSRGALNRLYDAYRAFLAHTGSGA